MTGHSEKALDAAASAPPMTATTPTKPASGSDTEQTEYIVVCQQIIGNGSEGFHTHYGWDGERFPNLKTAIRHGFKIRCSDDFNIGVVQGEKLISFDWMDKPIGETPETLLEIQEAIFNGY